jgi:hypothetical protein
MEAVERERHLRVTAPGAGQGGDTDLLMIDAIHLKAHYEAVQRRVIAAG